MRTQHRDSALGIVILGFALYELHFRVHQETVGWADIAMFSAVAVLGLIIGYRDRVPLLGALLEKWRTRDPQ